LTIAEIPPLAAKIRAEIARTVVGQSDSIELILIALFSGGHILLEGPPGTAKTLLARTFAAALDLQFSRVQFTPDLMPGDVIGANIFDFQSSTFRLTRGPIFTEILLADEINRTPPKTQAALLEAMQERAVTIDGERHVLSARFTVIATQNPIEQQGTYPLPEAQLDRFLFKHVLEYPSFEEEAAIVTRINGAAAPETAISLVADARELEAAIEAASSVRISADVVGYIVKLIRATRNTQVFSSGASPRAAAALAAASRAKAALDGRDYVLPDDVKALAKPLLRHRVVLSPSAEIEGRNVNDGLSDVIAEVEAPR